jgi:hypothetical protein
VVGSAKRASEQFRRSIVLAYAGLDPATGFPAPHFQSVAQAHPPTCLTTNLPTTSGDLIEDADGAGDARVTVEASACRHNCPFDLVDVDPELVQVNAAWPRLSADFKRSILAIVALAREACHAN